MTRRLFEESCLLAECRKLYSILFNVEQVDNVCENAEIKRDFLREWQGFLEEYSRTEDFLILISKLDELKTECDQGLLKCSKLKEDQEESYASISAQFSTLGNKAKLDVRRFLKEQHCKNRVEVIDAQSRLMQTEALLSNTAEEINRRSGFLHEEIKARLSEFYDDEKTELSARYEEQLGILDRVAVIQQAYSTQVLEIMWMQCHLAQAPSPIRIRRPLSVIFEGEEGVTSDDSPAPKPGFGRYVESSPPPGGDETRMPTSPLVMAGAGFKR